MGGNNRFHQTMKAQDCKRPVPDAEVVLYEDELPQIPENILKVLPLLPVRPCTGPTKRPQPMPAQSQFKPKKTVHFQTTDAESVEAQGVAAFQLLEENKKIEDYF